MFRHSVDLAARFSAGILRDEGGKVLEEWDSSQMSPFQVAAKIGRVARDPECELTLVEDVPMGISQQGMVKPPLRFQGAVMMACWKTLDSLLFIDPARWMRHFPGVKELEKWEKAEVAAMGLTKAQAKAEILRRRTENMRQHADAAGYVPPDLVHRWQAEHPELKPLKKYTDPLEKSKTDYIAAFLISEFSKAHSVEELRGLQGISPPYI